MKKKLGEAILFVLVINFFVIPLWSLAITGRIICWPHRTCPTYDFFLEVLRKIRANFRPETHGLNAAGRTQRSLGSAHLRAA